MRDNERSFVDTNVWLYAFVGGQDATKSAAAASLLQRASLAVSVQVINEVCVNLLRKAGVGEAELRELVKSFFAKCLVVPFDQQVLIAASGLREGYSLSFWDSLIVASALSSGASILYSDDLQHELLVDGVLRIINPFVGRSTSLD
jgi:predicted nucleic acid-binding protein